MKPPVPPSLSGGCPARGFSLLEVLVAMAVLSVMMVFLFNLVAQTMRAWELGNKQVEATQVARIGLEVMAQNLQFALGGSRAALQLTGTNATTNIVPFHSVNNANDALGLPSGAFIPAPSSGQIFALAPQPLSEVGFMSVYVVGTSGGLEGYHDMRGRRYFLMRHSVAGTNTTNTMANFAYKGSISASEKGWVTETNGSRQVTDGFRTALVQNCYQLSFRYASNNTSGVLQFFTNWTSVGSLPAGVLVTAKVMDEKTAGRIAQLKPNGLSATDVAPDATNAIAQILREGTVEVSRFIPFLNSTN